MSDNSISRVWPGWETEGVLGTGTFGTVYLIRSEAEGNTAFAAGKVIRVPPNDDVLGSAKKLGVSSELLSSYFEKFRNDLNWELTMYRTVRSPHLVAIDDMAMEPAKGPGFSAYIRSGIYTPMSVYFEKTPPTQDDAVRLGRELCAALEALGEYSLVHGEIVPENVLVADSGSFALSDFGIRRCLGKVGTEIFGSSGGDFDAPELANGGKYTQQTDIFSLGMLMCYVANGCSVPANRDVGVIEGLDKEFAAVIKKAISENPHFRYHTAAELRRNLTKLSLGRKAPRRAMAAASSFEMVKRNGGAIRGAGPLAAAAVSVGAASVAAQERQTAQQGGNNDPGRKKKKKNSAAPVPPAANTEAPPKATDTNASTNAPAQNNEPSKPAEQPPVDPKREKRDSAGLRETLGKVIKPILAALLLIALLAALLWIRPWEAQGDKLPGDPDGDDLPNDVDELDHPVVPTKPTKPAEPDDPGPVVKPTDPEYPGDVNDPGNGENVPPADPTTPTAPSDPTTPEKPTTPTTPEKPTTPTVPTTNVKPTNNDVIFQTDKKLITYADMEGMDRQQTYMVLNEMYARHGKIFKTPEIQAYFESQVWYKPVTSDDHAVTQKFNDTEKTNLRTIVNFQKEKGFRDGGPTDVDAPETPPTRDGWLFPSDTQLITFKDLEGKNLHDTNMLINEIYARHGKIYKMESIQSYFNAQSWYTPVTYSYAEIEKDLSEIEWKNIYTILDYQKEKGLKK